MHRRNAWNRAACADGAILPGKARNQVLMALKSAGRLSRLFRAPPIDMFVKSFPSSSQVNVAFINGFARLRYLVVWSLFCWWCQGKKQVTPFKIGDRYLAPSKHPRCPEHFFMSSRKRIKRIGKKRIRTNYNSALPVTNLTVKTKIKLSLWSDWNGNFM